MQKTTENFSKVVLNKNLIQPQKVLAPVKFDIILSSILRTLLNTYKYEVYYIIKHTPRVYLQRVEFLSSRVKKKGQVAKKDEQARSVRACPKRDFYASETSQPNAVCDDFGFFSTLSFHGPSGAIEDFSSRFFLFLCFYILDHILEVSLDHILEVVAPANRCSSHAPTSSVSYPQGPCFP